MKDKNWVIDNVGALSAANIVDYIKQGIVTYDELISEAGRDFAQSKRREVQRLLTGREEEEWQQAKTSHNADTMQRFLKTFPNSSHRTEGQQLLTQWQHDAQHTAENSAWQHLDKTDINALRAFVRKYPDGPHADEARQKIYRIESDAAADNDTIAADISNIYSGAIPIPANQSKDEAVIQYIAEKQLHRDTLLALIKNDHNIFGAAVVKELLRKGRVSRQGLRDCGIDEKFIRQLDKIIAPGVLPAPSKPVDKINKLSTEIYFWGIPASGKTCALGALLSVASDGNTAHSLAKDSNCQGYDYMSRLAELFGGEDVCLLPEGTQTDRTYEMAFNLYRDTKHYHPITLIDLAGEIVECMYLENANVPLTNVQASTLETLTRVLIDNRSKNRKIHFFVLEYGAENKTYKGITQRYCLDGAVDYLGKYNIFRKDTDAIYILITKSDKVRATDDDLQAKLKEYMENTYLGFYHNLQRISTQNEMGEVEIIPFSLGQICFQHYCLFDKKTAQQVVKVLLNRTKEFSGSSLGRIAKKMK